MLEVKDVHYAYGDTEVLRGISFAVASGELCGLFGPNGCGKTTIMRCCLRFLAIRKGEILVDGQNTGRLSFRKLARLAAYVPQEHRPPFPYRVREIVEMGRNPHTNAMIGATRRDRDKAMETLELLGLAEAADRPYHHLSGGQRQLVLIARALAQETRLILMDEPTSSLDFSNQIRIWSIVRRLVREGITVLACTHDPNHVSWFCDQVVVMDRRGILAKGPPREVITEAVLNRIYPGTCRVRDVDSVPVVLPRDLQL